MEKSGGQSEKIGKKLRKVILTQEMVDNVGAAAKIKNNRFNVFRSDGKWVVFKNGALRAMRRFPTKEEALVFAEKKLETAKNMYIIVHNAEGEVEKMINR